MNDPFDTLIATSLRREAAKVPGRSGGFGEVRRRVRRRRARNIAAVTLPAVVGVAVLRHQPSPRPTVVSTASDEATTDSTLVSPTGTSEVPTTSYEVSTTGYEVPTTIVEVPAPTGYVGTVTTVQLLDYPTTVAFPSTIGPCAEQVDRLPAGTTTTWPAEVPTTLCVTP